MKNYATYTGVPFYRRNWFVLTICLLLPLAIHLLIGNDLITEITAMLGLYVSTFLTFSGGVYYQRAGQLKKYGMVTKVVLVIFCILGLISLCKKSMAEYYYQAGRTHHLRENYYAAIESYEKSEKWNDSNPELYYSLGNSFGASNQYDKALKAFSKAINLKSDYFKAYAMRGVTNENLGFVEKAVQDITIAHRGAPDDQSILVDLERNQTTLHGPTVKGIRLGMKIDEALVILKPQLIEFLKAQNIKEMDTTLALAPRAGGYFCKSNDCFEILADSNKLVTAFQFDNLMYQRIAFYNLIVIYKAGFLDHLFQSQALYSKDFMQKFIDNYYLPNFTLIGDQYINNLGTYMYSSQYGWELKAKATTEHIGWLAIYKTTKNKFGN